MTDISADKREDNSTFIHSLCIICRYVRKWWAKVPLDKRIQYKELFGGMKGIILSLVGALLVAGVVNYIIHLQTNPMTGRTRFISLSQDQIMTIAEFEEEGVSER